MFGGVPPRKTIDVDAARAPAFGLADDFAPFRSHYHQHARHQILYAVSGLLHLEVNSGSWLLPPQRAAFLTAGTRHRVYAERAVALRTVYLSPQLVAAPAWDCRVFTVSALAREMFLYAMRWPHDSDPHDPLLRTYFVTLAALALEWTESHPLPFRLPVAQSAPLRRATRLARARLGTPIGVADLAQAAAVSVRTLRRQFDRELGLSPYAYLHKARMLAALARLADPRRSITDVALAVGFETPSAFCNAFTRFVGESPRQYRQRLRAAASDPSAE
jgi:AraC-like DNA-binding protein